MSKVCADYTKRRNTCKEAEQQRTRGGERVVPQLLSVGSKHHHSTTKYLKVVPCATIRCRVFVVEHSELEVVLWAPCAWRSVARVVNTK
jgi:hypothetical protein